MIKYLSLFSGIGAFEKALKRNGIKYELVGFSEIDEYAIKSYCAVHNVDPSLNLGDISKIDITTLPNDIDLITHGSPCQDFSVAGKQAGGDKGSGTRSSLMWCTVDIVEQTKPKYVVWENVKNLLSTKNRHNFDSYINIMSELGYNSYHQVLNAKNYGIPQNRERVFTVSIRSDVDKFNFEFPEKQELKLKLKDMLETEVDKKYYLSDSVVQKYIPVHSDNSNVVGKLDIKGHDCIKRVYSDAGISPTLTNMQGGNRQPKIIDKTICLNSKGGRNGIEGLQPSLKDRIYDSNGIATCVATSNFFMPNYTENLRIRKLTPRECWRLMGFDDEDFEKAKAVPTSDTQLYKQAGNSIVVNVLEAIFKKMRW